MNTNDTNTVGEKLIYKDLSYKITGACFDTHNEVGRFVRERQYGDTLENFLNEQGLVYTRELRHSGGNNILYFVIEDRVVLELKAKKMILKSDFYQLQRYLQHTGKRLGLLVNFRNRYLKPIRIIRIDTDVRNKFT